MRLLQENSGRWGGSRLRDPQRFQLPPGLAEPQGPFPSLRCQYKVPPV